MIPAVDLLLLNLFFNNGDEASVEVGPWNEHDVNLLDDDDTHPLSECLLFATKGIDLIGNLGCFLLLFVPIVLSSLIGLFRLVTLVSQTLFELPILFLSSFLLLSSR